MSHSKDMRNMTTGSPAGHILAFALPLLAGSFLQQMYNMVDSWVVGNFVGSAALAAVGMAFPVMFLFMSVFLGVSSGATVVIAQFFGGGRMDKVRETVDTIYTAFVTAALPLTILAMLMVEPIMTYMQVDPAARADTRLYLLIICAGLTGNIGYNITAGILNGLGNSKSTLIFLATAAVTNTVLDLVFVLWLGIGVMGVALATIIAQALSWLCSLVYINSRYPEIAIRPFCFRFDREIFGRVMKIGIPAGIQMAMVSLGSMTVMGKANSFGSAFMGGYNVGNKIDAVAFLFIQSVCNAVTAFVGQNIGARKPERVRQGIRAAVAISVAWCLVTMSVILPLRETLVSLFNSEPEVIYAGSSYLNSIMRGYALFALLFTMNGAFRGAGNSVYPMLVTTVSMIVLRVPCVYWMADHYGAGAMFYGFWPGWIVGDLMCLGYYFSPRWKRLVGLLPPKEKREENG